MKKAIALLLACMLLAAAAVSMGDEAKFVTVREWLDAKGECGECMLLLKIKKVVNPVLAKAADETGEINLFSGNGEDSFIVLFMGEDAVCEGDILVIANPRYNLFEDTVEMADWTVLRIMHDPAEE